MRTVKSLIEELKKFPEDALCYAYEGERSAVVISDLGGVQCSEMEESEENESAFFSKGYSAKED